MHEYMHDLYEIKEHLLGELATYKEAERISPDIAEQIRVLASGIEKICKITEEMDRGHSGRGTFEGSYRGGSYRGGSYEGGSYEDGGSSGRRGRDSMGRYTSRESGNDFFAKLENLMSQAPSDTERNALQDMINRMRH